jgi:hypothetical protein
MVVERGEFFAELDGLTEKEIEARLDLWDEEQLALIQEYLDQKMLRRAEAEQPAWKKPGPSGTKTEQVAQIEAEPHGQDTVVASFLEVANTANTKATAALIFSVGAMLAAVASALIAFLALRGWTMSW